jgi:hypothetical protein
MENKKFLKTYQREIDTFRKVVERLLDIKNAYGSINWKLVVPEKQKVIEKIASSLEISPKFIDSMFTVNDHLESSGASREALVSQVGQYLRFALYKKHEDYAEISRYLIKLYFEDLDNAINGSSKAKKFKLF